MIASARIRFDRNYFATNYDDWLAHRSKWRKYEIWCASVLLMFGILMVLVFPRDWMVGGILTVAGLYEVTMAATHRRRSIHSRLATVRPEKTVCITFYETDLTTESRLGTSRMRYSGFDDFTVGTDGFFLVPDTGVSIYVPRATLDNTIVYQRLVQLIASQVRSSGSESPSSVPDEE